MHEIVITGSTGVIGQRAVDGADVVVNLLTYIPRADRMAHPSPGTRTTACGDGNFDSDTLCLTKRLVGEPRGSTVAVVYLHRGRPRPHAAV
jgi:hypothetical protein